SDGIGESLARDQSRKERAPGCPAESTDRGRDQHDQINELQGEIVEVKRRVPLEDSRDRAQQLITPEQEWNSWNGQVIPGNERQANRAGRARGLRQQDNRLADENSRQVARR